MENDNEDVVFEEEAEQAETQETTEEKPKETPEAKEKRLERQLAQLRKKMGKEEPKKEEPKEKKNGLDRLDKAILRVEKITAEDEVALVEDIMRETGKDVEAVLASKYFQAELKAMREDQAIKDATPTGTKRSNQLSRNDVDYWIAKGELPKDNPELARKVVNAKMARHTTNQFADIAVIS